MRQPLGPTAKVNAGSRVYRSDLAVKKQRIGTRASRVKPVGEIADDQMAAWAPRAFMRGPEADAFKIAVGVRNHGRRDLNATQDYLPIRRAFAGGDSQPRADLIAFSDPLADPVQQESQLRQAAGRGADIVPQFLMCGRAREDVASEIATHEAFGKIAPGRAQYTHLLSPNDASVVDEVRTVGDREAYDTKVELGKREGLLVGISAGAAVHVALAVARELGPEANVLTILCDTGERYFSLDEYFK